MEGAAFVAPSSITNKNYLIMKKIKMSSVTRKLGAFKGVSNFMNKNQFELRFENGNVLQSYQSIVAVKVFGMPWMFGADHDYSHTTCRHVKAFCDMDTTERRKAIELGEAYAIVG